MSEGFKLESGGLHKFLVGPFYLFEDVFGAFVPGIVFLVLMLVKHVPVAESALAVPYLGYKTKIAAGLLVAFVVGKVFQIPSTVTLSVIDSYITKSLKAGKIEDHKTLSDAFEGTGNNLVTGFVFGLFVPQFDTLDYYSVRRGQVSFYLTTGLVLLTASFVRGDSGLILAERGAGISLLVIGAMAAPRLQKSLVMLIGGAAANTVVNGPKDYDTKVVKALRVLLGTNIAALRAEILAKLQTPRPPDEPAKAGAAATNG